MKLLRTAGCFDNKGNVNVSGKRTLCPIIMVFRRTRKRGGHFSGGGPPLGLPSFRLDDECDRAASLIRRLIAPDDEENIEEPNGWDELYSDTRELFLGSGQGSKGSGGTRQPPPSLDDKHATISRIKSEDMDEYAAANLAIPQDTFEAQSNAKIEHLKKQKETRKGRGSALEEMETSVIRSLVRSSSRCFMLEDIILH